MSSTVLLNLDSKDGTFSTTSTTYSQFQTAANPHIVNHALNRPLKNVSKISLKSVELPITAENVRAVNGTPNIEVHEIVDGVYVVSGFYVYLDTAHYTSITTLLADINTEFALHPLLCGTPIVLTYVFAKNVYKVVATCANATGTTTFKFVYNAQIPNSFRLPELLGFTQKEVQVGTSITATYGINLNYDMYYNVSIYSNQLNMPSINNNGLAATFKLPVNATKGTILFWNDETGFKQSREVYSIGTLNNLTVQITDKWGCDLPCLSHFSITLELECDGF